MNKNELERRVRTWYSAEIVDGPSAPLSLRAAVDAIPGEHPSARRPSRRRFLLLAAALVTVGMGGALAVGSSLFRTSTVQPNPPPPIVAVVSPSPDALARALAGAHSQRLAGRTGCRTVVRTGVPGCW